MREVITSRQNPRVRELRAALRRNVQGNLAGIEGRILVNEALAAQRAGCGLQVETIFLREDAHEPDTTNAGDVQTVILSREAFDSATGVEQSQGIAATVTKPEYEFVCSPREMYVIAAGLQDPGNLGTLIRSAEAFGAAAVLLADHTVDPWNGKALRASAGAVFRMPLPLWSEKLQAQMQSSGIRLLAAVAEQSHAVQAHKADLTGGCAFLIGNEGSGLSNSMLARADGRITLRMPGGTESLNAAVAGSLLLYEAARQRDFGA